MRQKAFITIWMKGNPERIHTDKIEDENELLAISVSHIQCNVICLQHCILNLVYSFWILCSVVIVANYCKTRSIIRVISIPLYYFLLLIYMKFLYLAVDFTSNNALYCQSRLYHLPNFFSFYSFPDIDKKYSFCSDVYAGIWVSSLTSVMLSFFVTSVFKILLKYLTMYFFKKLQVDSECANTEASLGLITLD